jgi:hypothetical protein
MALSVREAKGSSVGARRLLKEDAGIQVPLAAVGSGELPGLREPLERERDGWAAAGDHLADEVMGKVEVDHDPVGGDSSESFGEVAEEREDAILGAGEVQAGEAHRRAVRLAGEMVV